jgi:hypothetical protein
MSWGHFVIGIVLTVGSVLAVAMTYLRAEQLRRNGLRIPATVLASYPGGVNRYPPYGSWGPRLEVGYELNSRQRKATIWLEHGKDTDYEVGQSIELLVSRHRPHKVRTGTERNIGGGLALNLEMFAAVIGLGFLIWALVDVIRGA